VYNIKSNQGCFIIIAISVQTSQRNEKKRFEAYQ